MPLEPLDRLVDNQVAGTLSRGRGSGRRGDVAVGVEALRETPVRLQDDGADERPRLEPARLQPFGERRVCGSQRRVGVVANGVRRRQQSREQTDVRRQRQRGNRERLLEQDAFARQPFQVGHADVHEPVRRQPVGSRRVQRHEQNAKGAAARIVRTPGDSRRAATDHAGDRQQDATHVVPFASRNRWFAERHESDIW